MHGSQVIPDWLNLLITDDGTTRAGLMILVGIAIFFLLLVHIPVGIRLVRARLATSRLKTALNNHLDSDDIAAGNERRNAVYKSLDHSIFGPNIRTFNRGWNDSRNESYQSPLRFAGTFLEYPLLPPGGRRNLLGSIPGMFLAFGILGTFLGLTLALSRDFDPQDTSARIAALTTSLSLAFRTSLLGIGLSVLFMLLARILEGRVEHREHSIDNLVHEAFPWLSPDEVSALSLKEQTRSTATITAALESVSADLQNVLADGLQEIRESASNASNVVSEELIRTLSETLNEGVGAHLSELTNAIETTTESQRSLSSILQTVKDSFQTSVDAQRNIQSMLQETANSIENASTEIVSAGALFGPAASDLSTAGSVIKDASASLSEIQKSAAHTVEGLADSLSTAHAAMEAQQSHVEKAVNEMNDAMKGFGEGLSDDLAAALGRIDEALGESIARLNGTIHDSNETIDRFAPALAEVLESIRKVAEGAQSLGPSISGMGTLINESITPIPESMASLGRTNSEMAERLAGIANHIEKLDGSLREKTQSLAQAVEELVESNSAGGPRTDKSGRGWPWRS